MKKIFAQDPVKGQVCVGSLDTDTGLFTKEVTRRKHYFRLIHGYALQKTAFDKLKTAGTKGILIVEKDTGNKLYASLNTWEKHGGLWNGLNGKQKTLSEKYFKNY